MSCGRSAVTDGDKVSNAREGTAMKFLPAVVGGALSALFVIVLEVLL